MTNDFSDHANFFSRSIVTAFTTLSKANANYVRARHHHVEKPRHALDYTRVHFNTGPRDDGRASAMVMA